MKYKKFSTLSVGELRRSLDGLSDDLPIVGLGHFGEMLECGCLGMGTFNSSMYELLIGDTQALILEIEDAGEEPE